jgi:4-amino-4-deoxy-L-arabinose transferase-like glycosyltransferase
MTVMPSKRKYFLLMGKKLTALILGLILFTGMALRLINLDKVPAGLHFDEAQAGYNAFLLLHTGKNLNGQSWPIDIDSFGDYRPALISYLTIPSVALLGNNEFSTRLPMAIFGVLLILLIYKFSLEVFENQKIAVLASGLFSISPMAVIFSRATSETTLDVFFEIAGLLCVIMALKKNRPRFLIASYFFWLLAYFSYPTSRVLTLPMGALTIGLTYLQFRPPRKLFFLAVGVLICYFIFPWVFFMRTPIGLGRAGQVNIFTFPEVQRSIDEEISEDGNSSPIVVSRFFHNKITGYFLDISARYASFFSPNLVLFSLPKPDRYYVAQVGAFTVVEFTGFILALGSLLYKKSKPLAYLPLIFLFLAPLPSVITFEDSPNFQRAIYLVPMMQIVAGYGIATFLKAMVGKKRIVLGLALLIIAVYQLVCFVHQYFVHEPKRSYSIYSRVTEMKPLVIYLTANQSKKILMSEQGAPYIYFLFYNKISIFDTKYTRVTDQKYFIGDYRINNFFFSKYQCLDWESTSSQDYDIFIINNGCKIPVWANKLAEFYRSDGTLAAAAYDQKE